MGNDTLDSVLKTLKEKFGHSEFKSSLQKDAVIAAVQGIQLACEISYIGMYNCWSNWKT